MLLASCYHYYNVYYEFTFRRFLGFMHTIIPYPHERGPTTECRPTPHFGLDFLLRSSVYLNMRPCVAALENAAQMAGL